MGRTKGVRTIDKIDQLFDRLDRNLSDYYAHIMSFDRQSIIEMASRITVMTDVHDYLKSTYGFDDTEIDYLLQFQNPLEVVADEWQKFANDKNDMNFAVGEVFDKQDALHDYPLVTDAPRQSPYLKKFADVDVLATLKAIADQVNVHYPNDIKIDMEHIPKLVAKGDPELKMLLWHVSDHGTHILPERDAFVSGTGEHSTWTNYLRPGMLSYAVEITGMENGKVKGNVYELNHEEHVEHVRHAALPATTVTISYEDGREDTVTRRVFDDDRHRLMSESGNVTGLRFHPEDESVLANLLRREQRHRTETPKGNFKPHLKKLADNRVNTEAERVVAAFKELTEPNSPNKTHFAVPLSRDFMYLASSRDQDRLFDALPYKSKAITGLKGEKGLFVTVAKDELLKQSEKAQKPSVLGQLAEAAKEAAARPKAAEQSKKHDKEAR